MRFIAYFFKMIVVFPRAQSSATLGALFGGPVAGLIADKFGRKSALIFSAIPLVLGWLAIAVSVEQFYWPVSGNFLFSMLVVGRAFSGFGSGWISLVVPVSLKQQILFHHLCLLNHPFPVTAVHC